MTQTTRTRIEAIEALMEEFTTSDEYEKGMEEHRNAVLGEYLESNAFMEEVAEAQAEILANYRAGDEYENEMDQARDSLLSEYRAYLEALLDDALAEEAGVVIEPDRVE